MKVNNKIIPVIQEAELKDKIVLVRVDHNIVKKGEIHDPYRIDATIGTLYHIVARGGKLILMTHVGRPKDKQTGRITISSDTSVSPIVDYLQTKLHIRIAIPDVKAKDQYGYHGLETSVNHYIRELKNDHYDAIYLPNTRWFSGEESKGEEADNFAYQLAGLADVFVNDAFGSWQPHASTYNITKYLPSYAGFLMQKEIENLDRIWNPQKPFVAVVAGAKFDTKVDSLYALVNKADKLILGGVIYNAYLSAKYGFNIKGIEKDDIELASKFISYLEKHPDKLLELPFIVESDIPVGKEEGKYRTLDIRKLPKRSSLNYIFDVAPGSFELDEVKTVFNTAKSVFVNAVMGFTPHFNEGTIALDELIDQNRRSIKLYGGGDTMQELKRLLPGLYIMALDNPKYYIFTGGGAVLKAIEQGDISGLKPVMALIENRNKHHSRF